MLARQSDKRPGSRGLDSEPYLGMRVANNVAVVMMVNRTRLDYHEMELGG
jgi:hypothetical protein